MPLNSGHDCHVRCINVLQTQWCFVFTAKLHLGLRLVFKVREVLAFWLVLAL